MDPELIALATTIGRAVVPPPAFPSARPAEGQTREQWLAEVAQVRTQHDAAALQASRLCPPLPAPPTDVALSISYVRVPVGDGLWQGATVYRPDLGETPSPAVLVLHGGGWWMAGGAAGFEIGEPFCRYLASALGAVVVNFDYRLAPEFPYPTGVEDAESAARWIAASAADLGIDPARVGLFGVSSGGNLAAALCRRLRDTDLAPAVAMLLMPALDVNFDSPSAQAFPDWQETGLQLRALYVQDAVAPDHPEVSPALATDPAGLPPTAVAVGEYDALHDDGVRYVELLAGAGVDAALLDYPMTHGIVTPDVMATCLRELTDFGSKYLRGPAV